MLYSPMLFADAMLYIQNPHPHKTPQIEATLGQSLNYFYSSSFLLVRLKWDVGTRLRA
jgi:hypothetical protein